MKALIINTAITTFYTTYSPENKTPNTIALYNTEIYSSLQDVP